MAERELLASLRNGSLKAEERLKVACALARYGNSSCLAGRKVNFLARWACEEICRVYSKKSRSVSEHARKKGLA